MPTRSGLQSCLDRKSLRRKHALKSSRGRNWLRTRCGWMQLRLEPKMHWWSDNRWLTDRLSSCVRSRTTRSRCWTSRSLKLRTRRIGFMRSSSAASSRWNRLLTGQGLCKLNANRSRRRTSSERRKSLLSSGVSEIKSCNWLNIRSERRKSRGSWRWLLS